MNKRTARQRHRTPAGHLDGSPPPRPFSSALTAASAGHGSSKRPRVLEGVRTELRVGTAVCVDRLVPPLHLEVGSGDALSTPSAWSASTSTKSDPLHPQASPVFLPEAARGSLELLFLGDKWNPSENRAVARTPQRRRRGGAVGGAQRVSLGILHSRRFLGGATTWGSEGHFSERPPRTGPADDSQHPCRSRPLACSLCYPGGPVQRGKRTPNNRDVSELVCGVLAKPFGV